MSLVQLETGAPVPQSDAALIDAESLQRELERAIEGEVRFDIVSRALYSTDASVYKIQPLGVVIARHREDVLRTFELCRRFHCPLTLRGGGTSQAGQAIGTGLQLDISKYYNRVLEVNAEQRWVRVEPGIVLDELNAELAPLGLRFAPDISTASRATIGGMMANNSAGARSVLYGKTIDHVLEQTVLLADGSIVEFREIPRSQVPTGDSLEAACYRTVLNLAAEHADEIERRYPKVIRRVGGYNLDEFTHADRPVNLAKIMVGSEGTLGIVLEAKLKLVPLPKAKAVMVISFHELLEALSAAPVILEHKPSAVEVMDKHILDNTRQNATLDKIRNTFIEGDPGATLCVEFYGDRKEDLPARLRALEEDLRARKLGYYYHTETGPEQARIWSLREAALGLSMAMKEDAKSISFVEDTAVMPERLSEYIGRFLQIIEANGTTAGVYAHASVGCLHVRPVVNLKTEQGIRTFEAIAQQVADLVIEFGGALSGEHGDGMVRSPFMRQMFGDTLYEAFRTVKRTFDPQGILNPGKIVDSPPLTANLRFGAGYITPNPRTFFDYSEYGGFGGAVEMCSGVGACRKKLAGTMCPSYMATRDESATTRGRANVLRMAMAGRLGEAGLGDDGTYKVLDLCLECRACKAECPVGVDMARFKSEFLADYYSRHGTPLRAKALGNVHKLNEWGSLFAPLSNWIAGGALGRWMNEAVVGVDRRRKPPVWRHQTFAKWLARRPAKQGHRARDYSVQRHLHELLRSGNRNRGSRDSGARRLHDQRGAARMLRASADLARAAGASGRQRGDAGRRFVPHRAARREDRVLRAELLVVSQGGRRGFAARSDAGKSPRGRRRQHVVRRSRGRTRLAVARRAVEDLVAWALPSEVHGHVTGYGETAFENSFFDHRRTRRGLLRHGRIVWIREGALRRLAHHRQS